MGTSAVAKGREDLYSREKVKSINQSINDYLMNQLINK